MAKITITKNQFDAVTKLKDTVMNDGGSSGATGKVESSGNTAKDELKKTISDLDKEYKNSPVRTYGDIEVPLTKEKVYEMPSDEEIKNMSWTTFVSGCTEPELIEYLKTRRIYINEPIDSEEDL